MFRQAKGNLNFFQIYTPQKSPFFKNLIFFESRCSQLQWAAKNGSELQKSGSFWLNVTSVLLASQHCPFLWWARRHSRINGAFKLHFLKGMDSNDTNHRNTHQINDDCREFVERGYFQISPSKDTAGRTVIFFGAGIKEFKTLKSMVSEFRVGR